LGILFKVSRALLSQAEKNKKRKEERKWEAGENPSVT